MPGIEPRRDAVTAAFADPDELLRAVRAMRAEGHEILDTYTPFPVHGMDDAMGLRRSRLNFVCGGFALAGILIALGFQWWSSVVDYPVMIGGKPLNSLPAFLPVTFELAVLLGALGVVFSLFVASGLRPRFTVPEFQPGANDDRFVLALKLAPGATRGEVLERLRGLGALDAAPWVENYLDRESDCCDRELGPAGLALVFAPAVLVLCAIPVMRRDYARKNIVWDAGMMTSPAYGAYGANPVLPNGQTIQAPPAGTRARGVTPELYAAGPEEALRAGLELKNPLTAPGAADLARGKQLFDRVCAACHGVGGKSDGPIIPKFPNPPSLVASHAIGLPDGQLFHIATHGQGLMKGFGDVYDAQDRWRLVSHIRVIQAQAAAAAAAPAPAPASAPAAQSTPGSTP